MMFRIARWTGYALLVVIGVYVLAALLEDVPTPTLSPTPALPEPGENVGWLFLAFTSVAVLVTLLTLAAAKKWDAKWPLAIVAAALAVVAVTSGYHYWRTPNASYASGGSTSDPGVNTDGLDDHGKFPLPPPGIPQRGSPGATSWDPQKPPMAAEPKAPAFVASATLDDGKPFAGDLSLARWCEMCASGKLRQKSYDRLRCDPTRCQ